MKLVNFIFKLLIVVLVLIGILWHFAHQTPYPEKYDYGVSFNTMYARELGLDWKETYTAVVEDLGVHRLRLAAHWPMVEPNDDEWNFEELDTQMRLAEEYGVEVILAVGRRLPRWPECHIPAWAQGLSWEEQQAHIRTYIEQVVTRYKDSSALMYWQVENEPFLTVFAHEYCGNLDKDFLEEEVALVHSLDDAHKVLLTDSGNLGTWMGAYRRGDLFGTSVYVYLYNEQTGPFKTVLPPEVYVAKRKAMELLFGEKETMLIELSLEPWMDAPIASSSIDVQLARMSIDRVDEILEYAKQTRLQKQYLWGAEWWYWLKEEQGHPEYWQRMRFLFAADKLKQVRNMETAE